MIPFQTPDVRDVTWVRPLLESEGLPLCDYSFPVLFCWKAAYGFQYAPSTSPDKSFFLNSTPISNDTNNLEVK